MTPARRACGCNDFSRTSFIQHAVAEAGRGLPAIEPGMPLPPGTGLSRRSFLSRSLGLALSVYGASVIDPRALELGIAKAQAAGPGQILVSIYLAGGADSLSMLYPHADPDYQRLRPKLALAADAGPAFAEDQRLGWHPALEPLTKLYEQGKVTVMSQIGLETADGSHFNTLNNLQEAAINARLNTGWLGRYLDVVGAVDNPLQGISLDGSLDPLLATVKHPVAAMDGPFFQLSVPSVYGKVETRLQEAMGDIGSADYRDASRNLAAGVMLQSRRLIEQMAPFGDGSGLTPPVEYPSADPDGFPTKLAGLAGMISSGLPLSCVAMTAPGLYDTHDSQVSYLDDGLARTFSSIAAFQADLESRGVADRVLIYVWTEFGRRPEENGSNGTDHGAAGLAFLIGTRVRGQLIGEFTNLKDLDPLGNLKTVVDFRSIYCSVLEQWFGVDAGQIVPNAQKFARAELFA